MRNPDYDWAPEGMSHTGPAYLERIIYKEVAEPATRMTVLQTDEANFTHFPVLDEVASMEEQGFQVYPGRYAGMVLVHSPQRGVPADR